MKFYLGTHMPNWLGLTDVPLFVSRRRLTNRKTLPVALGPWALDSGGFTQLDKPPHHYTFSEREYVLEVKRFSAEIGHLEWVAPMDWMCEPFIVAKTRLGVTEHQRSTVVNFLRLRYELGPLVIPVLQGYSLDDYLRCWERYHAAGVDLEWEPIVGLGSICRRQNMHEAGRIVRALAAGFLGRQLHGFGVKLTGLESFGDVLASADSMAWSYAARRTYPMRGHTHKSCANCLPYALRWRGQVLDGLNQQRIEVAA